MTSKQITFRGHEFASPSEAIQHADATRRGEAITYGGRFFVVQREEARRLEANGVAFAYLYVGDHHEHEFGVLITVPVN